MSSTELQVLVEGALDRLQYATESRLGTPPALVAAAERAFEDVQKSCRRELDDCLIAHITKTTNSAASATPVDLTSVNTFLETCAGE